MWKMRFNGNNIVSNDLLLYVQCVKNLTRENRRKPSS